MSYLVFARKYRPQGFEALVGQGPIAKTLRNALSEGRIAHAFLFTGSRGVGKTSTARILAKGLNCAQGPTAEPCGACESCRDIAAGTSVNVFEIDGASNTGVDDVRALRETLQYLPPKGKYKIYIIDEVHMLSTSAFNALLKTLEEPPEHVVFIFATTEPHKIPATILSRCQRFDFRRIPVRDIAQQLRAIVEAEGVKADEGAVLTLAREAGGSMRDALSLLDQAVAFSGRTLSQDQLTQVLGLVDRTLLLALVRALIEHDPVAALRRIDEVYERGYDLRHLTRELLEELRSLVVVKVGAEDILDLPEAETAELKDLAGKCELSDLQMLFALFRKGAEDVLRAEEPRVVLEMEVVKLATVERVIDLDRLARLVQSGGGGGPPRSGPGPSAGGGAKAPFAPPPASGRPGGYRTAPEAPGPASAAAPEPPAGEKSFAGFLAYVGGVDAALKSLLDHARLLANGDGLELGIDPREGDFLVAALSAGPKRERLDDLAARYWGAPKPIAVRKAGAEEAPLAASVAEQRREEAARRAAALEAEVRASPLFQAVERNFPEGRVRFLGGADERS